MVGKLNILMGTHFVQYLDLFRSYNELDYGMMFIIKYLFFCYMLICLKGSSNSIFQSWEKCYSGMLDIENISVNCQFLPSLLHWVDSSSFSSYNFTSMKRKRFLNIIINHGKHDKIPYILMVNS